MTEAASDAFAPRAVIGKLQFLCQQPNSKRKSNSPTRYTPSRLACDVLSRCATRLASVLECIAPTHCEPNMMRDPTCIKRVDVGTLRCDASIGAGAVLTCDSTSRRTCSLAQPIQKDPGFDIDKFSFCMCLFPMLAILGRREKPLRAARAIQGFRLFGQGLKIRPRSTH